MIALALLAGAVAGTGVWLTARGFAPPPTPLATALAELERPRSHTVDRRATTTRRWAAMLSRSTGTSSRTESRLALLDRSIEEHAIDKLTYAVLGAGLPVAGAFLMALGGVEVPPVVPVLAAAALATIGFFLPELLLRTEADRCRATFNAQLALFLDLVVVLLAGGRGVEGALLGAAAMGDGIAFVRIRRSLSTAQLNRESPWRALDRLARESDVAELAELTASVTLAGESGARVRDSLSAKARSIRVRLLANAEADAHRRSEAMTAPVVMMLTGFIVLIGFPAVHALLTF